ncbi:MAG TPA: carboxypeptidase-like regulatory domain-containing protein, partial [Chitinophagaceae bacterium]|nr:carboxypeptidase-like regulatory domain-containing protein [Chitinophagaceae bacterium]
MKKIVAWTLSMCMFTTSLLAQQVAGSVKDEQGKALSGATVALKKAADSSVVKLAVTNQAGKYEFADVRPGK